MQTSEDETAWDRQAAQVRADVQAWRIAHPTATLRQIEQEVDRQLAAARARLVEAVALAGPVAVMPPPCPDCGSTMRWEGERTRRLTTTHDQAIALTRRYARCPRCGTGLFPPG
jgi:ribosomal protein S27AE